MRKFVSDEGVFEFELPKILTFTTKNRHIYHITFLKNVGLYQ